MLPRLMMAWRRLLYYMETYFAWFNSNFYNAVNLHCLKKLLAILISITWRNMKKCS